MIRLGKTKQQPNAYYYCFVQTPLTFFQRMQIARDVALAMNWLHCMVRLFALELLNGPFW